MAYDISQADPKTEKKFLQTKPTYRPNHRSEEGGIALPGSPPGSPPASHRPAPWAPSAPVQTPHRCKISLNAHKKVPIKAVQQKSLTYSAPNAPPAPPPSLLRRSAAILARYPSPLPRSRHQLPRSQLFFKFFPSPPLPKWIFEPYRQPQQPSPDLIGFNSSLFNFFLLFFPPLQEGGKNKKSI